MPRSTWRGCACALAVLLCLCWPAARVHAQTVNGRTLDGASGTPLRSVQLRLLDSGGRLLRTTASDSAGRFSMSVLEPGTYRLEAFLAGYDSVRAPIAMRSRETADVELRLGVRAVAIEPLTVTARRTETLRERDFRERDDRIERNYRGQVGRILLRDDILENAAMTLQQLWLGHYAPLFSRCEPTVYLNGTRVTSDDVFGLALMDVEVTEFYRGTGAAGSRFVDAGGCGVFLVWTLPLERRGRPFAWRRFLPVAGLVLVLVLIAR